MRFWTTLLLAICILPAIGQTPDKYDGIVDSVIKARQQEMIIPCLQKELVADPQGESILRKLGYSHIETQPELWEKYYRHALLINPKCLRCDINLASVVGMKEDYQKVAEYLDSAMVLDPNNGLNYVIRARLKEVMGDLFGASADLDMAIQKDPQISEYYISRGLHNVVRNYYRLAFADFKKAIDLAPTNYYPYYQRATVYYHQKKYEETLADLHTAIALDSTRHELYTIRGATYAGLRQHENSVADYTRAIQLSSPQVLNYYNRALEKYQLEDVEGACADFHTAMLLIKYALDDSAKEDAVALLNEICDTMQATLYYHQGIAFYNAQKFDQALNTYHKGLKKFPHHPMILYFRGHTYFALQKYEEALSDYAAIKDQTRVREMVKNFPLTANDPAESVDLFIYRFFADNYGSIAECEFALGHYEEARIAINKAIQGLSPTDRFQEENYYNVRGNILLALGKYEEAKNDFDRCIELAPSFHLAYINRAIAKISLVNPVKIHFYSIRGGIDSQAFNANWILPLQTSASKSDANIISALADCDQGIELDPTSDYGYYVRGRIKKMLLDAGYCADLIKANDLDYRVEPELLEGCKKN